MRKKNTAASKGSIELIELIKRSRTHVTSTVRDENQNTTKKSKHDADASESGDILKILDELAENVIKTGIRIYHKRESSEENYSDQDKHTYLMILKKIQDPKEWLFKRIYSNRPQLQCLLGIEIVKKEERKDALSIVEQWNDHKVAEFPAKYKKDSCEYISRHYRNRLKLDGLQHDTLISKIKDYSNLNDSSSSTNSNIADDAVVTQSQLRFSTSTTSSVPSVIEDCCRLCGKSNCKLVISLNKRNKEASFKNLVEYFCR
jgi:hypothetical protein